MAFQRKYHRLEHFDADVLVIQECADRSVTSSRISRDWDWYWVGDNPHKGLAVLTRKELRAELRPVGDCGVRHMLVVRIGSVYVVAFWAMDDKRNRSRRYIGQVWNGLVAARDYLAGDVVVIGDFNWNAKFAAREPLCGTFAGVVDLLSSYNVRSAYHAVHGVGFGEEPCSTFFMARKPDRGYHIDYAFLSGNLMSSLRSFAIGAFCEWGDVSDHVPLVLDIDGDYL